MSQISRFITGANALDFVGDMGTGSPQNDVFNILGGTNVTTTVVGNTLTIDSSGGVTSPTFEGDGGGTAQPAGGVIQMEGGNNLTTSAANDTVTFDVDGNVADSFTADSGSATPSSGVLQIVGGTDISTSGAGNTITIDTAASGGTISPNNIELAETDSTGSVGVISMENSNAGGAQERLIHAGDNGASGLTNFFAGARAGNFSVSQTDNTGIGFQSLQNIGSSLQNVAVGFNSGANLTESGGQNVAIGVFALDAPYNGTNVRTGNVAVGRDALTSLEEWQNNTALGDRALTLLLNGFNNIGVGRNAGLNYTGSESNNLLIGSDGVVGENSTIRIGNDVDHSSAFISGMQGVTPSGTSEVALIDNNNQLGSEAQLGLARGGTGIDASGVTDGQLLIGGTASNDLQLSTLTGGNNITVVNGTNSITIDVDGNVADSFTADSGSATPSSGVLQIVGGTDITTSGAGNTITIDTAASGGTISPNNIELAETDSTGSVGVISMQNSSSGVQERLIHAGDDGISGLTNFFAGALAGNFTAGVNNTAVGQSALEQVASTGTQNVAVGNSAGAGLSDASGGSNVAVGANALQATAGGVTARQTNTAIGKDALVALTDDVGNTGIGNRALVNLLTGNNNIALGSNSGINLSGSETNNIYIGNSGVNNESSAIRIGDNTNTTTAFIYGIQGVTPTSTTEVAIIDTNSQFGSEPQLDLSRGGTGIDASGATDGQLLIGGTASNDLQLNTLTGGNNITVVNGTNSITIDVDGNVADSFSTDSGSATPSSGSLTIAGGTSITTSGAGSTVTVAADGNLANTFNTDGSAATPSSNSITIAGGTNVTTSGSGSTITIDASGGGGTALTWQAQSSDITMSVNNGYIPSGTTGTLTLTLPSSASVGDRVAIAGFDADGWQIDQNTGQTIHFGDQDSTTGTGGNISSNQRYDSVELICVVSDSDWVVRSSIGNISVT